MQTKKNKKEYNRENTELKKKMLIFIDLLIFIYLFYFYFSSSSILSDVVFIN